jgi:hypothetical protein
VSVESAELLFSTTRDEEANLDFAAPWFPFGKPVKWLDGVE